MTNVMASCEVTRPVIDLYHAAHYNACAPDGLNLTDPLAAMLPLTVADQCERDDG